MSSPRGPAARADALRQALRMTNEAFAERLPVAVRTVAYWRERPDSVPQPAIQEALDTLLAQAPELARAQFWLIVAEREQVQASPQLPPTAASRWTADDESLCDPARRHYCYPAKKALTPFRDAGPG